MSEPNFFIRQFGKPAGNFGIFLKTLIGSGRLNEVCEKCNLKKDQAGKPAMMKKQENTRLSAKAVDITTSMK